MNRSIKHLGKRILPQQLRLFFRKLNWQRYYLQQTLFLDRSLPRVYCPIAEKEFKAFVKIGRDLITPSSGARNRQRLVWLYLKNELNLLSKEATVLHVAPELPLLQVLQKQKNLTYIPGDKMVKGYSNQRGVRNIDLTKLDFEDKVFDYEICSHVLEHIADDQKAIAEMYRVLKPGGVAVLLVPMKGLSHTYEDWSIVSPDEREKHFGQWDHVRWYCLDIKDRLEVAGFAVEFKRYCEDFTQEEIRKYGLSSSIIIIARKKYPRTIG